MTNHGGKREGAGRKAKEPTTTVSFRVSSEALEKAKKLYGKTLNQKVNQWLKRLTRK